MSPSIRLPHRSGFAIPPRGLHRAVDIRIPVAAVALLVLVAGVGSARAAGGSVNLDQWASSDLAWQNGNLNGNNSRYPEGGVVPFRLAVEGLAAGSHSIHINYDFTAGGHKAYDFLATWNITNAKGKICAGSGGGISSMCPGMPAASSAAFPSDRYRANGLPVTGAEGYSAAPRRLTIWGGTITSISNPTHAGSPNGNSTADFVVRFTSTGPAVLLAWGGHLAQSAYWDKSIGGSPDGASQVSGAPWHMRTLQLDASGNKNQDRSIQPSAIVGELPPFALAPTPPPTPRPTPRPAAPVPTPRPTSPPAAAGPTPVPGGGTPPGAGSPPGTGTPPGGGPPSGGSPVPGAPINPPAVVPTPPATSTLATSAGETRSSGPMVAALGVVLIAGVIAGLAAGRRSRTRLDHGDRRA